ncbi:unnamed protein product [Pipistrellus nathusii]|uniref:Uncharacterized protein n=1 Tax=Pipistrellus nathusii TaxID=59473 RepID=A0ABP0AM48_PIPNA
MQRVDPGAGVCLLPAPFSCWMDKCCLLRSTWDSFLRSAHRGDSVSSGLPFLSSLRPGPTSRLCCSEKSPERRGFSRLWAADWGSLGVFQGGLSWVPPLSPRLDLGCWQLGMEGWGEGSDAL